MKIHLKKSTKIIIIVLLIIIFLAPEKYSTSAENTAFKQRIRYRFPANIFSRLFGIKPKTYIMVDSFVGSKGKTIHLFNYLNDTAYQLIFNKMNLDDVQ